jgi:hypothetical protein
MINCRARSHGGLLLGEANREAPAQAELRPTCTGASCVNLHPRRCQAPGRRAINANLMRVFDGGMAFVPGGTG